MNIKLFKVQDGIKFKKTVFEGIGKYLLDDWEWFKVFEKDNKNVLEYNALTEDDIDYSKFNIDKQLSEELEFIVLNLHQLYEPLESEKDEYLEYIKCIHDKYETDLFEDIYISHGNAIITKDDVLSNEVEALYVKYIDNYIVNNTLEFNSGYKNKIAVTLEQYEDLKYRFIDPSSYVGLIKLEETMKSLDNFFLIMYN